MSQGIQTKFFTVFQISAFDSAALGPGFFRSVVFPTGHWYTGATP